MKKITKLILVLVSLVFLTACGKTDFHKKLQENEWQVVSTNGESYSARFASDTVSFDSTFMSKGYEYAIDEEDRITLKKDGKDEEFFIITEKAENELYFEADEETTLEDIGNLTLTPLNKEN